METNSLFLLSQNYGRNPRKKDFSRPQDLDLSVLNFKGNSPLLKETWMRWAILFVLVLALAGDLSLGQPRGKESARGDATVDAWVQVLAKNIADRHDIVRESARVALASVGKPALPTLKKLAAGKDDATADAARKLIARIQTEGKEGSPAVKTPSVAGLHKKEKATKEGRGLALLKNLQLPRPLGKGFSLSRSDPVDSALKKANLSKDQQSKAAAIRKSYGEKTREQLKAYQEAQKKLRSGMLKDVKEVLLPEQQKKFDDALKKGTDRKAHQGKSRKVGFNFALPSFRNR
jgi:hypothetical protein